MILTYHNIGDGNNETWVSVFSFKKQMEDIKNRFEVVALDNYDPYNPKQIVLSFHDGRKNIFNALPILKELNFPFHVFIVGNLIGKSEEFLEESDFKIIEENGGILGWHTHSHLDLTTLPFWKLKSEIKNPYGWKYLAYPYWKYDDRVIKIVKKLGYKFAHSGNGFADIHGGNLELDSVFMKEFTPVKYINDKIVKYIDMALFSFPCNMRCRYCYVGQYASEQERAAIMPSKYTPKDLEKALNKKRMGGTCIVTFSAAGETLLLPHTLEYLKAILRAGHFLHVSTNLTITKHIEDLLSLSAEMRSRLFFKASIQYLELKRLNLQKDFIQNCHKIWKAGATCALEIVPNDDLIPYIPEIKKWCLENFGALPQLSLPRNEAIPGVKLLSKFSLQEFARNWEDFYSEEFRFKVSMWEKPITDFCYAGKVSCFVIINTGEMLTCPKSIVIGNFFEGDLLTESAVAKCPQKHCFVCHNWLGFGSCPPQNNTNYLLQRDRIGFGGVHWVSERCRHAFRQRVCENNKLYSLEEEKKLYKKASKKQKRKNVLL
ncbi:polysaccharide deacetylase family protein [Candidatus Avelusimicrobium stercoris]|uniref:polysaccharide deacetylase family protein n=1 Tax=Candidatus Avelusimicrobium stercoris TaxID=1947924 RepID=UPI003D10B8D2